ERVEVKVGACRDRCGCQAEFAAQALEVIKRFGRFATRSWSHTTETLLHEADDARQALPERRMARRVERGRAAERLGGPARPGLLEELARLLAHLLLNLFRVSAVASREEHHLGDHVAELCGPGLVLRFRRAVRRLGADLLKRPVQHRPRRVPE